MKIKEKRLLRELATAMKNRRIALKMSQSVAAKKAEIGLQTLNRFENTGVLSTSNLIKLLLVYKMNNKVLHAFNDRSDWTLEQIESAETKKKVRPKKKKDLSVFVVPVDEANFGTFTKNKRYQALYGESTFKEKTENRIRSGRSFIIKDDTGKELLITEDYCKEIIEDE